MTEHLVLSEDDVLELVAFFVTAARLLPEEPADYGPARLVSAAQRLCTFAAPRSTEEVRHFLADLAETITPQIRQRNSQPEAYLAFLDESTRAIARLLKSRAGRRVEP